MSTTYLENLHWFDRLTPACGHWWRSALTGTRPSSTPWPRRRAKLRPGERSINRALLTEYNPGVVRLVILGIWLTGSLLALPMGAAHTFQMVSQWGIWSKFANFCSKYYSRTLLNLDLYRCTLAENSLKLIFEIFHRIPHSYLLSATIMTWSFWLKDTWLFLRIKSYPGSWWRHRRPKAVLQREVEQPPWRRLGGGLGGPGHRVPATDYVPGVLHRRRCPRVRCPTVRHHHRLPEDGHQALVGRDPRPGGPQQGWQDPQEQEAGPAHDAHRGGGVLTVLGSMAGIN